MQAQALEINHPLKDIAQPTMNREPILLTPGPLSTSLQTKLAMLRDWGSWDSEFNAITARLCESLLQVIHGQDSHVVVPLQGSGTFSVEAAVASLVPRNGHLLVLDNGAYSQRAAKLTQMMGRRCSTVSFAEDQILCAKALERALVDDASISHVLIVHCETGSGLLNPLEAIAAQCERFDKSLIVDAMSSFGGYPIDLEAAGIDFIISSANKCVESVPGFSFVLCRRAVLLATEGWARSLSLNLLDQLKGFEKNGQFRYTPPTHSILAFAQALKELELEGGIAARAA
ncbi:MAG: 2-aminoethylphosphonate--pyruvate transaminase, partial [Betaproteobacteria bacterium]|nr:2-aminoethylphosphonate--pyruvate transaminase [Betaproteobacteria bacterium]